MNYIKYPILIFISFVLVFIDISFFSFIGIFGATLLSSLIFLVIFSILNKDQKDDYIVALSMVLFFSIFSSLPLPIIFIGFFLLPFGIGYVRKHYFSEPSPIGSIPYFLMTNFIFEGVLILYVGDFSSSGLLMFSWFILLNTFFGFLLYSISQSVRNNLMRGEIKL